MPHLWRFHHPLEPVMSLLSRRALLVLAFVCLVPLSSFAQELRYKFQAGSKANYVMEQKQTMKMGVQGQDFEMKSNMNMDFSMAVDSVDTATGNAKVTYKIDGMKMSMSGPMGNMEYDSKSDKEPEGMIAMAAPLFKAMTGAPITMTVSPRGEISNVKLPDKLKEEFESIGGGQMNFFSEDQLKQMMNNGYFELPKEAPTTSTTWNKKMDMKLGPMGTMNMNTTYTYAGKSAPYDKINTKIDMKLEPNPSAPFQLKMKTKEASGTILFDNTKGRLQEMKTNVVSELEMGEQGKMQMTQDMTMKLKQ
jgi:hypothetical protein